jgi:hypothetical protein
LCYFFNKFNKLHVHFQKQYLPQPFNEGEIMKNRELQKAEPFDLSRIHSLGDASRMLVRQYNFPHIISCDDDKFLVDDSDRLEARNGALTKMCFRKHMDTSTDSFDTHLEWFRHQNENKIIAFLINILEADESIQWTGFRVTATINARGWTIWGMQLFAKHPKSDTTVYSGEVAPNVLPDRRYPKLNFSK